MTVVVISQQQEFSVTVLTVNVQVVLEAGVMGKIIFSLLVDLRVIVRLPEGRVENRWCPGCDCVS